MLCGQADLVIRSVPGCAAADGGHAVAIAFRGVGVLEEFHRALVDERTQLPARSQAVAQLRTGLPAFVAVALVAAQGERPNAVGAAHVELFRAVEVAAAPLGVELGEQLQAVAQVLQAYGVEHDLVEAAGGTDGVAVQQPLFGGVDGELAVGIGQREAALSTAEQAVLGVSADAGGPQADLLAAMPPGTLLVIAKSLVFILQLGGQA